MKIKRIQQVENYIQNNHEVTNRQLCEEFNISMQTLRRDIDTLVRKGSITKVYGGVIYNGKSLINKVDAITTREKTNDAIKRHIANSAASLIESGDVIFLDSGTTVCKIIPHLKYLSDITVVTHSLIVLNMLSDNTNIKCICLGGLLNHETLSFIFNDQNQPFRFNKAFIGTAGIDAEGLTSTDLTEGKMKENVINNSDEVIVLCDHSKFNIRGFYQYAKLKDIDVVVTDIVPNEQITELCKKLNIIVIAG